jgi:26S proteasome regulatory subunit N9
LLLGRLFEWLLISDVDDRNVRLDFVQKIIPKVDPPVSKDKEKDSSASKSASSKDAKVYLQVEVSSLLLYLQRREEARAQLDECEKTLEDFDSVEGIVHAAFYKVNAEYYQTQMDFAAYYKNALLYLACINIDELSEKERRVRAYDLSIAALVSDSIYNFGELLLHPILSSLEKTEHAWLRELLFLFNRGDLKAYNVLEANLSKNNLLGQHRTFLIQKISLAALTELVFRRPPHDRALSFTTIAKETNVAKGDVEHLVMKALSLGLVKGQIDEVAEVARINWVQPKVLDMKQIESMRSRLREWDGSVNRLGNWIEGVGKDVWAA